jgi:hypothetical protein
MNSQTRNQVRDFVENRPANNAGQRPSTRPGQGDIGRPGQGDIGRPGQGGANRPNVRPGDNRPNRPGQNNINRNDFTRNVRNNVNIDRGNRSGWFNDNFWGRHNVHPPYWNNTGNWWRAATAVGVAGWLGWRGNPYYYDYYPSDYGSYWGYSDGYGTTPVYSNGTTSGTTTTTQPAQTYSTATQAIESSTAVASNDDWMPLGVFAVTREGQTTATPNMYVQLAVNKDGALSGTYYNTTTDKSYEAEGVVDQTSQRAAWKIVDNSDAPIIETGIFNLTQDEAPAQAHFADGRTENILLVRIDEEAKT